METLEKMPDKLMSVEGEVKGNLTADECD